MSRSARGLTAYVAREPRAFTRSELVRTFSQRQLGDSVRRGTVIRVLPATYIAARYRDTFAARADAAVLWANGRAVLGGTSAAHLHGVLDVAPPAITLVAPRNARLRAPDWITVLQPNLAPSRGTNPGVPTVSPADAVLQSWGQLAPDRATSLVIESSRRGVVSAAELMRRLKDFARVPRRRALVRLLSELALGIESYLEHVATTRVFNTRDFARLERQVAVRAAGQRYRLDLFDAKTRLAIELDGRLYHSDDASRRRDLARDADLASEGILTLRLTFEDITQRPAWCRARVKRTMAARRDRRAA